MGQVQIVSLSFRYLARQILAKNINLNEIDENVSRWLKQIRKSSLSKTRKQQILRSGLSGREVIDCIINSQNMTFIANIARMTNKNVCLFTISRQCSA